MALLDGPDLKAGSRRFLVDVSDLMRHGEEDLLKFTLTFSEGIHTRWSTSRRMLRRFCTTGDRLWP